MEISTWALQINNNVVNKCRSNIECIVKSGFLERISEPPKARNGHFLMGMLPVGNLNMTGIGRYFTCLVKDSRLQKIGL